MEPQSAPPPVAPRAAAMRLPTLADLGAHVLRNEAGLAIQLTRDGTVFAWRHGPTLINQVLPAPGAPGLLQVLLREHESAGCIRRANAAIGPGLEFSASGAARATWVGSVEDGLTFRTTLQLHSRAAAWRWVVDVRNEGARTRVCDLVVAHDLGLADEAAVRNNEAYTSQYIDLQPFEDQQLGWVVLARQNQPATGGAHPWLGLACVGGAAAFATDGVQVFGADHRLTGVAAAAREPALPSQRLQYECAMAAVQSRPCVLAPGGSARLEAVAVFVADHPAVSSRDDLERLRSLAAERAFDAEEVTAWQASAAPGMTEMAGSSLFARAAWLHGETPSAAEWEAWFPGPRRHEEHGANGRLLSFFHGIDTHVVSRDKEAGVARPHGHILRSGDATWIDEAQFGLTCFAAGVFAAQAYLGNPSFARLLPVLRNALGVLRATGQRIFVRRDGAWAQLGVPSAFAMTPGEARWIYRAEDNTWQIRVWCSAERSASFLEVSVVDGAPQEFLITHELVLGATEYEHDGEVAFRAEAGWAEGVPSPDSLVGRQEPGVCFGIAAADPASLAAIGGDELLHPDRTRRSGAYVVLESRPAKRVGVVLLGVRDGRGALAGAVASARREYADGGRVAHPPPLVLRVAHPTDPAAARLDEVVPWLNHNAAIHFSAPHGLEQYGGAAWGVRDVTQGSLEWLLTHGRLSIVRRMLDAVFGQQYARDGTWPQWFMHPPYQFIQQAHSHGDVCFWPVKALCDYVEAANDTAFMEQRVGYTDADDFSCTAEEETYWQHCDRVVDYVEARFIAGTALVNYGDGDWDDTLQPADPAMRTRMISAWTVALAYQTFGQLAGVARRSGDERRAGRLDGLIRRMADDFRARLMPGDVVAGFLVMEDLGARPLLHPNDAVTGIRYRLLPMTRSIIAGLFTAHEARTHLEIIERELRFPDGVRLMSEPAVYRGGLEQWFKRADTAANVGREIGLQYVHAHIRYAEALARVGDGDGLWRALQVVNPVGLASVVPQAAPRQSNVYFSSSDADFADRYEAAARWSDLRSGRVPVRGGWRLYSSGPGLYLHKVRACLLGIRESYDEVVFDPVLPRVLDGLVATVVICGRRSEITYLVRAAGYGPAALRVNGTQVDGVREFNPYRTGGWRVPAARLAALLGTSDNRIEIELSGA